MRIADLMTREVQQVAPEAPLDGVVHTMRQARISCIVVTEADRPVGVISERDLVRVLAELYGRPASPGSLRARDVMTPEPVTICADAGLAAAVELLHGRSFRRLPVVDASGRFVGIVTQTDLLRGHVQALRDERDGLERAVAQRTAELRTALEEVSALALEDGLLGIGNRRALEIDLAHVHATAERYTRRYGLALLDVDHFKECNDRGGHAAGDRVLRTLTATLKAQLRAADRLYRYGGDELVLLMPETDLAGAHTLARRMVEAVAGQGLAAPGSPEQTLTISAGVAGFGTGLPGQSWMQVLQRADAALYRAKERGRNRAEREEPLGVPEG